MVDKLQELVDAGPDPTRGLQHLVLTRFHLISRARARLRKWPEIAEALDMPADRAKALAASFYRVAKKVEAGTLEPPEGGAQKTGVGKGPKSVASKVDQDTGFRAPAAPKEKEADADDRKWM
jgi:hypothetical protein